MSELQKIDIFVFGTKLSLYTDEPEELKSLANDLDAKIKSFAEQTTGAKLDVILIVNCLKSLQEIKQLQKEIIELSLEREKLNKTLEVFFKSID